jgi:leucyl-tRNA synthetase
MYVFTTRADTIMGVTFCAVAAEHPLAAHAAKRNPALAEFVEECKRGTAMEAELATMEKKGMPTGLFVTHPLTGDKVEVWVGNYVLMAYGDGAVMGVPAHDERDFAFAKKYGLPIRQVIAVEGETFSTDAWQPWYEDKQRGRCVKSGKYDGLDYPGAVDAIAADLGAKGLGEKQITYRLRDWGVSRQRYWGTPVPIVHCASCGAVPVPEKDLPVVLPEDCVPDGSGNPLNKRPDFVNTSCPKCGGPAKRETDTLDTFVDSSWYYMRYCDPKSERMVAEGTQYWMPMDQYIGGIEHAILHLLYARFWTKVMRDMGLVKFDEPFTRLLTQGMVLNHIFFRKGDKGGIEYFPPDEVAVAHDTEGRIIGATAKRDGAPVEYGGVGTMSKSKLNGVDPQDIIDRYGADTARLYVMFAGPPEDTALWSDTSLDGASRFLRKLWNFAQSVADLLDAPADSSVAATDRVLREARREMHLTLRKINYDYERIQYNTVVSGAMILLNTLDALPREGGEALGVLREGMSIVLRVLYPVAPHIGHALWQQLGYAAVHGDILDAPWPEVDEQALVQDEVELVLQVNGKLRGHIRVPANAAREAIEAAAVGSEEFRKHANGATPKKVVVVPGRLVNVVV